MSTRTKTPGSGRKTKLSQKITDAFTKAIGEGVSIVAACQFAGVCERTYYTWTSKGEAGKEPYIQFVQAIKKAEAKAEQRWVRVIETHAADTWTAAAWLLERRFPDRWGRRERVQQEHSGGLEIILKVSEANGNGNAPTT